MTAPARTDPHQGQPVLNGGAPLSQARQALILVHGRGASAENILELAEELAAPDTAYLAPQAADHTWYPYPFLAPTQQNEPWLSSAMAALERCVQQVEAAGLPAEKLFLLGFSQGACLALEYAVRRPRRYAGLIGFSGGLIGSDAEVARRETGAPAEDFADTPVFMGCSDVDPHIPAQRFQRTAQILQSMGASVTARLYPGMGHTVNLDELRMAQQMLRGAP